MSNLENKLDELADAVGEGAVGIANHLKAELAEKHRELKNQLPLGNNLFWFVIGAAVFVGAVAGAVLANFGG